MFTISTRARAAKPYHMPFGECDGGRIRGRGRRIVRPQQSGAAPAECVLMISLFQNKSQRGRARSLRIASVNPTVLVDSASYFARTAMPVFRVNSSNIGWENSWSRAV